jgi:hypothetical protein
MQMLPIELSVEFVAAESNQIEQIELNLLPPIVNLVP